MVGAAAQEREEVPHPVGHAEAQHVAIELGHVLHVGDVEGDVAELVRHDALARELLVREASRLNTCMIVPFGSAKVTMSATEGSGSFLRSVLTPCAATCFSNASRSASGGAGKPSATQLRLAAAPQHDRMMIDRDGEIRRVLFLGDERQPKMSV